MARVVYVCGAAKAGTSWLYEQFRAHPGCHIRSIKELHYFNALERGRLSNELKKHEGHQAALEARLAKAGVVPTPGQAERLRDRSDWMAVLRAGDAADAYLAYLEGGAAADAIVADMTPAYGLLSESSLSRMARISPDARFIFILRDPFERLWSHVRMMASRRAEEGRVTPDHACRILRRTLRGEETEIETRSDYADAFRRFDAALPPGRLHVEVFEEMVAGEGLQRIWRFLGLNPMRGSDTIVHRGNPVALAADDAAAAFQWLRPQYVAARERLGRLPPPWRRV